VIQTSANEIRFDLNQVEEAYKGQFISIPIETKVRRSDKLFKVVDAAEVKHRR
jgi:U32 family peptidase